MTHSLKSRFLLLLMALCYITLYGCGKVGLDDTNDKSSKKYYTERQEKAFEMLQGKFVYRFEFLDNKYNLYEFGVHYKEPVKGVYDDGEECQVHGELHIVYYEGSTYNMYYWLNADATKLATFGKSSNYFGEYYYVSDLYDLVLVDADTFRIKRYDSYSWTTYKRLRD